MDAILASGIMELQKCPTLSLEAKKIIDDMLKEYLQPANCIHRRYVRRCAGVGAEHLVEGHRCRCSNKK
jgi:hypothetical protein